jgi:hypothetical protein
MYRRRLLDPEVFRWLTKVRVLVDRSSLLAEVRRGGRPAAGDTRSRATGSPSPEPTMGSPVYGTREQILGLAPRNATTGVLSIVVLALRPEFSAQA